MLDINRTRLYCQACGKIVSNLIKEEKIKDWIKSPYCFDCIKEKMLRRS